MRRTLVPPRSVAPMLWFRARTPPAGAPTDDDRGRPDSAGTSHTPGTSDARGGPEGADGDGVAWWPSWGDMALVGVALVPFVVSAVALARGADGFLPAGTSPPAS